MRTVTPQRNVFRGCDCAIVEAFDTGSKPAFGGDTELMLRNTFCYLSQASIMALHSLG